MFLVHKVTYRVFSQTQYRELATRVDHWRTTLQNVLGVLRQEQANAKAQREREVQELERKTNGLGMGGERAQDRRRGNQQREPREPREPRERNDNDD
jgi:translation initiation factor 3 subunit M